MTTDIAEAEASKPKKAEAPKQRSYFNFNKVNRFLLDDKYSYIEHKPLDEGLFEAYQDLTSTIKLDRGGQTTEVDMALGKTRKFLLENLVVNWNLVDEHGTAIPFTHKMLRELPPHIIGGLVQDIYANNAILETSEEEAEEGKDS